jgi:hypothetical protein
MALPSSVDIVVVDQATEKWYRQRGLLLVDHLNEHLLETAQTAPKTAAVDVDGGKESIVWLSHLCRRGAGCLLDQRSPVSACAECLFDFFYFCWLTLSYILLRHTVIQVSTRASCSRYTISERVKLSGIEPL